MTQESIALGQVIRRIRKERKMSQEDLCEKAGGIDQSYLSEIENGHWNLSTGLLFRIARALGVSGTSIVAEVEEMLSKEGDQGN